MHGLLFPWREASGLSFHQKSLQHRLPSALREVHIHKVRVLHWSWMAHISSLIHFFLAKIIFWCLSVTVSLESMKSPCAMWQIMEVQVRLKWKKISRGKISFSFGFYSIHSILIVLAQACSAVAGVCWTPPWRMSEGRRTWLDGGLGATASS